MKKAWNIIRKIIVWAIVVFSLGMMAFTIISVTTFDRADRIWLQCIYRTVGFHESYGL